MQTLKQKLESVWNEPGILNAHNINVWSDAPQKGVTGWRRIDGLFVAAGRSCVDFADHNARIRQLIAKGEKRLLTQGKTGIRFRPRIDSNVPTWSSEGQIGPIWIPRDANKHRFQRDRAIMGDS